MPTAQRGPAALLVRRGSERLLFDCGEGTQRQLQRSAIGLPDLQEIFLTHFHADHFLGLPGMLKTFALRGRDETPLTVYGPRGLRELFKRLQPFLGRLPYALTLVELEAGETLERGEYTIVGIAVEHGAEALGYVLAEPERPGRFDVAAADALGVPDGPARGRLQGGEEVTLDSGVTVTPADVLGEPRTGTKARADGRHGAVAARRAGCARRRSPRARGELPRRRGRARTGDDALDRSPGRRGRAPRAGAPARLDPRLASLLRPGARRRGPRRVPRHGRASRLRPDRGAVPRARSPAAGQERCPATAQPERAKSL